MTNIRFMKFFVAALLLGGLSSAAAADLESVTYSPDITVLLGSRTVVDHEVVRERGGNFRRRLIAGSANDVDAFYRFEDGSALFSLEVATVANGQFVRPGDIVAASSEGVEIVLDSRELGVPEGANLDAVSAVPGFPDLLLLSFDITVKLDGQVFADEDIIMFGPGADGQNQFGMSLDLSQVGIDESLDLDALHIESVAPTFLYMSFDGSGRVGNVSFDDEDVLEFDNEQQAWRLVYDGSEHFEAWKPGDLDALYVVVEQDEPPPPPPPPPPLPPPEDVLGDLDSDGDVDQADFQILSQSKGSCAGDEGFAAAADFDEDGCVTPADADLWFDHFTTFLILQILSNGVLQ